MLFHGCSTILNVEQLLLAALPRLETGVTLLELLMLALRRQLVLLGRVLVSRVELVLRARPGLLVQVLRLRAVLRRRTALRQCPRVRALQRAFALLVVRLPVRREQPEQQRLRRRAEQLEQRARLRAPRRARQVARRELRRRLARGALAQVRAGQRPLRVLHLRRRAVAPPLQREERLLLLRVPLPPRRREALRLQLV